MKMAGGARVVIVGGGFGGLYAARALKGKNVQVTVVDRRNHHLFQPLLYQVATAALSPGDIAYPIRAALRKQSNARVLLADAASADLINHSLAEGRECSLRLLDPGNRRPPCLLR